MNYRGKKVGDLRAVLKLGNDYPTVHALQRKIVEWDAVDMETPFDKSFRRIVSEIPQPSITHFSTKKNMISKFGYKSVTQFARTDKILARSFDALLLKQYTTIKMQSIVPYPTEINQTDVGGITFQLSDFQKRADGTTPRIGPDSVELSKKADTKVPPLLRPYTIRGVTLKNRIVVSPMCMYSAVDGFMNSFHFAHYGQFAIRGAGLIIFEATGVLPTGRISPACTGIWKDEHVTAIKPIVDFIHSQGSLAGIQLAHAGRKGSSKTPFNGRENQHNLLASAEEGGWPDNVISASAQHVYPDAAVPKAATKADIEEIINGFKEAARRANEAGIDVVEVHGAHGYLSQQFYSGMSNERTDEYGGSFENRTRFLTDIVKAVRSVWPENKPIFLRISGTEWSKHEKAWKIEDTIRLTKILYELGVDLIDMSSSAVGPVDPKDYIPVDYSKPWNRSLAKELVTAIPDAKVGLVGGITDPHVANEIIASGDAQLVLLARAFLRNPNWALDAARDLIAKEGSADGGELGISWPSQYARSGAPHLMR
ncbi:hypothetical protein HK098_005099 [Nowakowskiella sp. JEL0407]|nr:hypothetical protein HK098_005099 [Nowakowskiella sp. JEL0407]